MSENKIQNSIDLSPNYEQQKEEIELLKNIIPEHVTIVKSEPNFNIQIQIEGDTPEEEHFKTFYLDIFLNNNYPEKSPRYKLTEENDLLNEKKKETLIKKLDDCCQENLGFPVIYQLYEIVKEFADEEEKIAFRKKEEEDSNKFKFILSDLHKVKKIQLKDTYPVDIFVIKNDNILVVFKNGIIKIYDNQYEKIIFELLSSRTDLPIIFCKYFNYNPKNETLYLFTCNKVLIYKVIYLSKKTIVQEGYYKIYGNIKLDYLYDIDANDAIELPQYPNSIFCIKTEEENEEKKILLYKYENSNCQDVIKNKFEKDFRKLHYINEDKFLLASYTLKTRGGQITGINKLCLVETENFEITKTYDMKISPLNNSIETYKNKYLIFSYFTTIKEGEGSSEDPYYQFNDDYYEQAFHNLLSTAYNEYYDDYDDYHRDSYYKKDYDEYNNRYYSYDIKQHYIAIYSIKFEEFTTIIEYDLMSRINIIDDNLLCIFVRKGKYNQKTQITYERIFHEYYNEIPIKEESWSKSYKTGKYLANALLDNGINVRENKDEQDEITSFKAISKKCLAFCSEKHGLVIYTLNS